MSEKMPSVEVEDKEKTPVPEAEDKSAEPTTPTSSPWFSGYLGSVGSMSTDWMNKAKEQVEKTFDAVKKDLNEFSDTVNTEANHIKESVKQQAELFQQFVTTPDAPEEANEATTEDEEAKESLEKKDSGFGFGWMKTMVDTVKSLAIEEDTAKGEEQFTEPICSGQRKSTLDNLHLLEIQNSEDTFLKPPLNNVEVYKDWLKEFKLSEYNGEINILLAHNPKLREIYAKFVPSRVDNHTFWNRYFFRVYVAEMEMELRQTKGKLFETLNINTNPQAGDLKVKDEKKEVSPAATENESWSVCSSGADDLQEIPDDEENSDASATAAASAQQTGALTPRPRDADTNEDTTDEWESWSQKEKSDPKSA